MLLIRVGLHDIYRVQLTPGVHIVKRNDRYIVNRLNGSDWICSPLDMDLVIRDEHGFTQPLIAQSFRRLTREEVESIPHADRP